MSADWCDLVIAQVIGQVPTMAQSPIVVTAPIDTVSLSGNRTFLVAFAPFGPSDWWFDPPTWIVTRSSLAARWEVRPWLSEPLPPQFVTQLRAAGIAA